MYLLVQVWLSFYYIKLSQRTALCEFDAVSNEKNKNKTAVDTIGQV